MKLYHIDRSGHIFENQIIKLNKNFYTDITDNELMEKYNKENNIIKENENENK